MRALVAVLLLAAPAYAEDPLAPAVEAYGRSEWAKARELARKLVLDDKLGAKAWRLVGASSCFLKDRVGALDALVNLTKADQEFVRFACQKQELAFTDDDVAAWASPARMAVHEADAAYAAAKYAEAKKLALQATSLDPKLNKAWRILGSAACWTRDKRTAQAASEHLQPVDQEVLRALCRRTLGVSLKSDRVIR